MDAAINTSLHDTYQLSVIPQKTKTRLLKNRCCTAAETCCCHFFVLFPAHLLNEPFFFQLPIKPSSQLGRRSITQLPKIQSNLKLAELTTGVLGTVL